MLKLRDHYDWVVLGDHPGALLSGCMAARLGLAVLVLPVFPGKSLSIAQDGRFMDPEPNTILGLGRVPRFNGLLSECLNRLGILPSELEQIQAAEPLPQVVTPDMRLDFSPNDEKLEHSLQRELGKSLAQRTGLMPALKRAEADFLSFWLQLPERLTLSPDKKRVPATVTRIEDLSRALSRKISREVSGKPPLTRWLAQRQSATLLASELQYLPLVELLEGFWFGANGSSLQDPQLAEFLHLLIIARTGASFRGGLASYREFLLRLAKRLGAHVPPKLDCKRVFVDQGRFTGVQVASRANVVGAGGAIAGCGLSQLGSLVSMSGRGWLRKIKGSPAPCGWRFTVAFTVRGVAIPPGVSSRLVWKEAEAPPIEVEITDSEATGPGSGKRFQQRTLLARTVLPFTEETLQAEHQARVAARMLRQLTQLFPFLEKHLVSSYPEFRGPQTADGLVEFTEVYGFQNLDAIPENLRCLSPVAGTGVGSHSGIEGLFVATGESFPELGSFGSTVAALESISWLAHRSGLAGPFA